MSDETICDQCGRVEERSELIPCLLCDEPAHICLRCLAGFARYLTPSKEAA